MKDDIPEEKRPFLPHLQQTAPQADAGRPCEDRRATGSWEFAPFYERAATFIAHRFSTPVLSSPIPWRVLLALAPAAIFLLVHSFQVGADRLLADWSLFLGLLITSNMLLLNHATSTLRGLLGEMEKFLLPEAKNRYTPPLTQCLSDAKFLGVGIFFGIANMGMGYRFGVPHGESTNYLGFFFAGLVSGMPVLGIVGVCTILRDYARRAELNLDYTMPDRCGGTHFLGEALVKWSAVTLFAGVLIALYIRHGPWTGHGRFANYLQWFWVVFPFMMSLLVLIIPASAIGRVLHKYKSKESERLQARLATLRHDLDQGRLAQSERKEKQEEFEFNTKLRKDLFDMQLWPIHWESTLKFGATFLVGFVALAHDVHEMITPKGH